MLPRVTIHHSAREEHWAVGFKAVQAYFAEGLQHSGQAKAWDGFTHGGQHFEVKVWRRRNTVHVKVYG